MPGNFETLFRNEEGFENILNDTKVIYEYSEKKKNEDLNLVSDKDFNEPLTFLFLGVDSEGDGLNANAAFNGDTLMLMSFNPKTLSSVLLSIPRDTYVPIACNNNRYVSPAPSRRPSWKSQRRLPRQRSVQPCSLSYSSCKM